MPEPKAWRAEPIGERQVYFIACLMSGKRLTKPDLETWKQTTAGRDVLGWNKGTASDYITKNRKPSAKDEKIKALEGMATAYALTYFKEHGTFPAGFSLTFKPTA